MSAVLTPVPAIPLLNTTTLAATALTTTNLTAASLFNATSIGQRGPLGGLTSVSTTSMPRLNRRGERSAEPNNDYVVMKMGDRGGGAMTIWPDGNINITAVQSKNNYNKYAILRLRFIWPIVTFLSQLRMHPKPKVEFRGKESGLFLCMNSEGKLYGSNKDTGDCRFEIKYLSNNHECYCSVKYERTNRNGTRKRRPCIGFGLDGKAKLGYKVRIKKNNIGWFIARNLNKPSQSSTAISVDYSKWVKTWDSKKLDTKKSRKRKNKKNRKNKRRWHKKINEGGTTSAAPSNSGVSPSTTTIRSSIFNVDSKEGLSKRRLKHRHQRKKGYQRKGRKSHRQGWRRLRNNKPKFGSTLFSRSER